MSREKPNVARNADVHLPTHRQYAPTPTCARELTDLHLWMLTEKWLRNGGDVEDRCFSMWGFEPTVRGRHEIRKRVEVLCAGEWKPWVEMAREGIRA